MHKYGAVRFQRDPAEIQRESRLFVVRDTRDGRGKGVFALQDVPPRTLVGPYPGHMYSPASWDALPNHAGRYAMHAWFPGARNVRNTPKYISHAVKTQRWYIIPTNTNGKILAEFAGYVTPYINEAGPEEQPNCTMVMNYTNHTVEMYTTMEVPKGAQLLICYGHEYNRNGQYKASNKCMNLPYWVVLDKTKGPQELRATDKVTNAVTQFWRGLSANRKREYVNAYTTYRATKDKKRKNPNGSSASPNTSRRRASPNTSRRRMTPNTSFSVSTVARNRPRRVTRAPKTYANAYTYGNRITNANGNTQMMRLSQASQNANATGLLMNSMARAGNQGNIITQDLREPELVKLNDNSKPVAKVNIPPYSYVASMIGKVYKLRDWDRKFKNGDKWADWWFKVRNSPSPHIEVGYMISPGLPDGSLDPQFAHGMAARFQETGHPTCVTVINMHTGRLEYWSGRNGVKAGTPLSVDNTLYWERKEWPDMFVLYGTPPQLVSVNWLAKYNEEAFQRYTGLNIKHHKVKATIRFLAEHFKPNMEPVRNNSPAGPSRPPTQVATNNRRSTPPPLPGTTQRTDRPTANGNRRPALSNNNAQHCKSIESINRMSDADVVNAMRHFFVQVTSDKDLQYENFVLMEDNTDDALVTALLLFGSLYNAYKAPRRFIAENNQWNYGQPVQTEPDSRMLARLDKYLFGEHSTLPGRLSTYFQNVYNTSQLFLLARDLNDWNDAQDKYLFFKLIAMCSRAILPDVCRRLSQNKPLVPVQY